MTVSLPARHGQALGDRSLKVDHAGEFGAINIYRAQIGVARVFNSGLVPQLSGFLAHEHRHLATFAEVMAARGVARCRSYWLCGIGGFALGIATGLLGKAGIMACTAAVETVVTSHLDHQLIQLQATGDTDAWSAVDAILADEREHQATGVALSQHSALYRPVSYVVSRATSAVIWLGMRL